MKIQLALASLIVFSGCATTGGPSLNSMIADGEAEALTHQQYSDLVIGNTIKGSNGSLSYLRPDGVKEVRSQGKTTLRKWYKDDDGLICQTLFASNKLWCIANSDFRAARSGSTIYTERTKGHAVEAWELMEGAPPN